jgi:hypothetical protein
MVERVGFLSQARRVRPGVVPGRCARNRWRLSPTRRAVAGTDDHGAGDGRSSVALSAATHRARSTAAPIAGCVGSDRRRRPARGENRQQASAEETLACSSACGRDRRRSGDLPLFRRSLCRLSYPTVDCHRRIADDEHALLEGEHASAVPTGFEPATSALTGRRALQTAPRDQFDGRTRGSMPMPAR